LLYDGDGNRVQQTVNGVVNHTYTYGHDLISQDKVDPATNSWHATFYAYDGHGNVRFLTNESGQVTDTYVYDAFGTMITATGTSNNRYLYTGEQFDPNLGLYYLRARLMNPLTGRFWSMDSYEGSGDDPHTLHKYLYTSADPVTGIDPNGHMTMTEVLSVGAQIASKVKWALPTIPGWTSSGTFVFRAVVGSALGLSINGYAEYYLPPTVLELEKLATSLHLRHLPFSETVGNLAVKGADLHVDITMNNALRPFFWAQLGIAFNGTHAFMSAAHMCKFVTEAEELVAEGAGYVGLPVQLQVNKLKTLSRFAFLKADPAGDVRVLRETIETADDRNGSQFVVKLNELRQRLKVYGEVSVGESSEY